MGSGIETRRERFSGAPRTCSSTRLLCWVSSNRAQYECSYKDFVQPKMGTEMANVVVYMNCVLGTHVEPGPEYM